MWMWVWMRVWIFVCATCPWVERFLMDDSSSSRRRSRTVRVKFSCWKAHTRSHKITHSQTKSRFRRVCAAPRRSYRERQRERERERARESRERERQTDRQTLHVSSCSSSSCMCPPPYLELPPPLQRVRKRLFALCAILYV